MKHTRIVLVLLLGAALTPMAAGVLPACAPCPDATGVVVQWPDGSPPPPATMGGDGTPGVKEFDCHAVAAPSCKTPYLAWTRQSITGVTITWVNGDYHGEWVRIKLQNLPSQNSYFGQHWVRASVDLRYDNGYYRLFFTRDGNDNPGGTLPNWYYYWSQVPLLQGAHEYYDDDTEYGHYDYGDDHFYIANLARLYNSWTQDEGIDTFAETCLHEGLHMTHYNQWHGQTDTDGDTIPDTVEDANSNGIYDPPTDPSDWQDANTFSDQYNDEERLCLDAMYTWSVGCVDSQDWANPGHQY